MTGYSGTPIAKKLGIKPGCRLFVADAPRNYAELVAPLPEGVQLTAKLRADTDVVHLFSTRRAKLAEALRSSLAKMKPEGAIWVSWPKKASRMETDITEDTIRQLALPMGLVDIKVCAVDETWSALKLVLRKEKRKPR
jgi:DUF3052 family protein